MSFIFPSCSSDEPEMIAIPSETSDSLSNEYIEIPFEITTDSLADTRCFNGSNYHSQNPDQDFCSNNIGFIMYSYSDNTLLGRTSLQANVSDRTGTAGSLRFTYSNSNGKCTISLRFLKTDDPSKYKFVFATGFGRDSGTVYSNTSISHYKRFYNENSCQYFGMAKLSETNDWSQVKSKITLNRINSDFYILTPSSNYGLQYTSYADIEVDARFGYDTNYHYFTGSGNSSEHWDYSTNSSAAYGPEFTVTWDITSMTYKVSTGTLPSEPLFHSSYSILNTNRIVASYNGTQYSMFTPLKFICNSNQEYPKDSSGRQINYIYLLGDEEDLGIGGGSGSIVIHKYNILPLPEGGIKPNKKYVYILNSTVFPNTIYSWVYFADPPITEEPSTATRSENESTEPDFQILEFDMDEPLPFEIAEP